MPASYKDYVSKLYELNGSFLMLAREMASCDRGGAEKLFGIPGTVLEHLIEISREEVLKIAQCGRPVFKVQIPERDWQRVLHQRALRALEKNGASTRGRDGVGMEASGFSFSQDGMVRELQALIFEYFCCVRGCGRNDFDFTASFFCVSKEQLEYVVSVRRSDLIQLAQVSRLAFAICTQPRVINHILDRGMLKVALRRLESVGYSLLIVACCEQNQQRGTIRGM